MKEFVCGSLSGVVQTLVGHPFDTIKTRIQNRSKIVCSFNNLYKGVSYPLFSSAFINAGSFGICESVTNNGYNYFISGFISGSLMSFFITPIELFKIKEQTKNSSGIRYYRGFLQTLGRESVGTSVYFGAYYYTKNKTNSVLFSGGLAGLLSCIFTYPIDTIKTRIQADSSMTLKKAIKMGNMWCGFGVCVFRCVLVNSLGFYVYEESMKCVN
jgi:solute carrier family 25 carnitine/acylcarnitine transporter 20/29